MGKVAYRSEYGTPRIGVDNGNRCDATTHLASQMFTDAVFNRDIRMIQMIITRIDGGLPKDTEVEEYQTLFGDCMNAVLGLGDGEKLKVLPTDTVMMALCKSLYDIAAEDIYHEVKADANGNRWARSRRPSTEAKKDRDAALRLITERAGGRKTAIPKTPELQDAVVSASWIPQSSLPQGADGETR
jgi:hypothetical protein